MLIAAQPGQHVAVALDAERNRLDQPFHRKPEIGVSIVDGDGGRVFMDGVGNAAGYEQVDDFGIRIANDKLRAADTIV